MTALAIWNERRPAPTLPDVVLAHLPVRRVGDRANYWLWLASTCRSPRLLWDEPRRWVRYMVTGGLVSLARGLTIALTGLGVPDPAHAGPGLGARDFATAFASWSRRGVFDRGAIAAYLTKDLFFSGHTATTFLLSLYLWDWLRLRWSRSSATWWWPPSVLLAHLHYAIDVVGAWAVTFAIFALREGWPIPSPAGPRRW